MSSPLRTKAGSFLGRLTALVMLVGFLPTLFVVGFLLRTNSDAPILLTDEVFAEGGAKVRLHRFRTTGRGTNTFHDIGRFLRSGGYDDLPALWDVLCGQIGLMQLYRLVTKQ